ncbi:MAG: Peptidoglycan glycosyltransferase [uncultured bacterium]|nr:MAG: Peptidoglycan glycosyltransferase [uncultured bacterium]
MIASLIILIFRLLYLQIVEGSYYRSLSDENRTRTSTIYASRGVIFDRNGKALVFNVPGFREIVNGKTRVLDNTEALSLIAAGKENLEIDSLRSYPYKDVFAHVLGYIGQISEEELKKKEFSDYNMGDLIGKAGIEQRYDSLLKGIDGKVLTEVDSVGKTVRKLGQTDPVPGENITLTLDANLQGAVYLAMKDVEKGVAIVTTSDGEILSILSKPSFDPNLFTLGDNYKTASDSAYRDVYEILLDSDSEPLLNRATQGLYPPGSTFKLVVAASALENGIIDENFKVEDTGILIVGEFSFANWYFTQYGGKDGQVDLVKGISRSNDIFFYKIAERVGVEKISSMAEKFGLGKPTGIDLEGEQKGLVPSPSWKEKVIGEKWYLGDTYHYGIGQGFLLTTPLQVNVWTQVIANGGSLYQQHLLRSSKLEVKTKKFLDDKTVNLIRQGMIESCAPGGVAWPLFEFRIKNSELRIDGDNFKGVPEASGSADVRQVSIACKTGTAETGGEDTMPHSWITLFAPAYDPEIVVTVLAENSGEGSNVAAPIAKEILEYYFTHGI